MNSKIIFAGLATAIVTAGVVATVPAQAATTVSSTSSCGEVRVALAGYSSAPKSNTVKAALDGTTLVNYKFASQYSFVFFTDERVAHVVTVKVTAQDGTKVTKTIKTKPCA